MKKKIIISFSIVILLFGVIIAILPRVNNVHANTEIKVISGQAINSLNNNANDIEQGILNSLIDQLRNLDLSNLEAMLQNLDDRYNIFGTGSFRDKIDAIVNGNYFTNFDNIFSAVIGLFFDGLVSAMPVLLTIVAVTILSTIINGMKSSSASSGVSDLVHFVSYSVVVLVIVVAFVQIFHVTQTTLSTMTALMEASFPVLLTLLTAVGAVSSVSIYQPLVAVLINGVATIFTYFLYPLFIINFVFIIISNLSTTFKLNKFSDLINSIFKWVIGFVLTLFTAFLSIQGISAGRFDSVSIRATRFAIKSYIPILGGFISEGFDFIILSSVLIKNAVGVGVLVMLFVTVLVPVVQILVFKFGLQLVGAVLEPVGNPRVSSFCTSCAKILVYPIAIMLGVAFMFLITVALIMTTANVF